MRDAPGKTSSGDSGAGAPRGTAGQCLHLFWRQELGNWFPNMRPFPSGYIVFPHSVENVNTVESRPDSGLPVTETFPGNILLPGPPPAPVHFTKVSSRL